MRTLHEVVVRNRLEQLRKRQRDEALQAQEELLAGVAKSAQRGEARVIPADVAAEQDAAEEVAEVERTRLVRVCLCAGCELVEVLALQRTKDAADEAAEVESTGLIVLGRLARKEGARLVRGRGRRRPRAGRPG